MIIYYLLTDHSITWTEVDTNNLIGGFQNFFDDAQMQQTTGNKGPLPSRYYMEVDFLFMFCELHALQLLYYLSISVALNHWFEFANKVPFHDVLKSNTKSRLSLFVNSVQNSLLILEFTYSLATIISFNAQIPIVLTANHSKTIYC
jgi:hypothetical protein